MSAALPAFTVPVPTALLPSLDRIAIEAGSHVFAVQSIAHGSRAYQVERLKYAISAEALAGPSEDVLPLFLQASG